MDYRQPVKAACEELANDLSGMEVESDGEVDLRLTDPTLIIDFHRLAHRWVRELQTPPNLYEVSATFHDNDHTSYFPWLSSFRDYLNANRSLIQGDSVVSFVESTGNDNTDRNYLRQRREALEDRGIDRADQILILLPDHIPEAVTQLLTVYHLVANGWMVTEDRWFSPILSFGSYRRAPGYGIPDIVAWQSEFTSELASRGWIRGGGTIHELAVLDYRDAPFDAASERPRNVRQTLTGEVKRSDRSLGEAVKQLYNRGSGYNQKPGYLSSNCFDEGYGILALQRGRDRNGAGVITFDEEGFSFSEDSADVDYDGNEIEEETRADPKKKQKLISHLDEVAAQTLVCNISYGELTDWINVDQEANPHHLLKSVDELRPEQIVVHCEKNL